MNFATVQLISIHKINVICNQKAFVIGICSISTHSKLYSLLPSLAFVKLIVLTPSERKALDAKPRIHNLTSKNMHSLNILNACVSKSQTSILFLKNRFQNGENDFRSTSKRV